MAIKIRDIIDNQTREGRKSKSSKIRRNENLKTKKMRSNCKQENKSLRNESREQKCSLGPKTLCNECEVRFKLRWLAQQYRLQELCDGEAIRWILKRERRGKENISDV